MKVAVAADHAGFELKKTVLALLQGLEVEVVDRGCAGFKSVDYPDFAAAVASMVSKGQAERGVLICGTGIGMAMVANKFKGVRAGVVSDAHTAKLAREHNDLNVLCLGARTVVQDRVAEILQIFISRPCTEDRHRRRLEKIVKIEEQHCS